MKRFLLFIFTFTISFNYLLGQNFTEVAGLSGMNFSYGTADFEGGGGISFADFNQDGFDDLTFCTELGSDIRYFQNDGAGGFTEIFPSIPENLAETKQVLWVDYDNDGDKDLFATAYLDINRLYQNNGSFVFTDVTAQSGLPVADEYKEHGTYGASFGDYNNDGWLDLYISNYGDGITLQPEANHFYRNVNGMFEDVTAATGTDGGIRQSFCSIFLDYDNDLLPDMYVANDRVEFANFLYRNTGSDYTDVSSASGAGITIWAMNTGAGDFDGDGDLDIYVTNVGSGNFSSMLVNNGGTFTDEAMARGVAYGPRIGWGGNFFDYDNDSDLDLYVCGLSTTLPNGFYVNQGDGNFSEPLLTSGGLGGIDVVNSYVNAIGDINNDGNLDIAVSNNSIVNVRVWENQETSVNNWLKVHLEGETSNRDGINCWIEAYADGKKWVRYTHTSMAYLAQNSYYHHFGVDKNLTLDSLIVRWPAGTVDKLENVSANQLINLKEGSTITALPVELQAFQAKPVGNDYIALNWEVENEKDFAGYEIQRSIDGRNFQAIGWQQGSGAETLTSYNFKDREVRKGIDYFYRLKMTDLDGSFEFSKVVKAHLNLKDGFELGTIHPNPTKNSNVSLNVNTSLAENIFIQVYNQTGNLILNQETNINAGENNISLTTENWTAGIYLVKVSNGTKEVTRKLIVH